MKFNFDWDCVSLGAPYVIVSEMGLTFNSSSVNMLGGPETVVVGFDEESMLIGIRSAEMSEAPKAYRFSGKVRNGCVRINCKDFIRRLSLLSGISFTPAIKYAARLDKKERILYIEVKAPEEDSDK